jgi:hypothetical protein
LEGINPERDGGHVVQAFARHKSPKAILPYFPEVDKSEDPPELWDYTPEEDHSNE